MPKTTKPTFAARLRSLRKARGLSSAALARRADLHYQSYLKLEHGERLDPSWSTIQQLADALECSTDELRV